MCGMEKTWKDYLTTAEVEELAQIKADKKVGQAQERRIYDRCRKRMDAEQKGI